MRKEFRFQSDGTELAGFINQPQDSSKIVIACHGYGSGKYSKTNRNLEAALVESGIGFAAFDFSGHYESRGDVFSLSISSAVEELSSFISSLDSHKSCDFLHVGLFGASFGGTVALAYAAERNPLLHALVLKSPVSDYAAVREKQLGQYGIQKWQETNETLIDSSQGPLRSSFAFYEDSKKYRGNFFKTISCPTLIIHGTSDSVVPVAQSEDLAYTLGKVSTLRLLEGGDHGLSSGSFALKVTELTTDYFLQNL